MSLNLSSFSMNGCLFETDPQPAPTLTVPTLNLPDHVDLRAHCSPVESQLNTNSCVANAVVGALEFHQKRNGLPATDLSRLFVYYNARKLAGNQTQDIGSFIHHGMAAVLAHGACEERMWPFMEAMVNTEPTMGCYQNASQYEAVQFARTPWGEPALIALSQGLPVVFAIYAPFDYYQVADKTGMMPRPDQVKSSQPPSGHAMLIVGFNLEKRAYLVRNSWGRGFADQGYCWIPFDTMEAWSSPEHFWTIGAIEQTQGFGLVGASLEQSIQSVGAAIAEGGTVVNANLNTARAGVRESLTNELETAKRGFRDRLRDK